MMKTKGRLLLLCLPLLFLYYSIARAELDAEEAIFAIKYKRSSVDFIVLFHEYDIFVPFEEVCKFLQIYYNIDKQTGDISGYINTKDNNYEIDLSQGKYKSIDNKSGVISETDWIDNGLNGYININFFADLFDLDVHKNFNELSVEIKSEYEMPVVRAAQVEQLTNNFSREESNKNNAPLVYSRDYNIINGGMLDYNLSGRNTAGVSSYFINSNLGMEILGGELQYGFNGRVIDENFSYSEKYRLRYQFSNDIVKSVSFGDIYNINYRGTSTRGYKTGFYNLKGVNITNESLERSNSFTRHIIEDVIEPGWIVELYVNDQLYDIQKTDLSGHYKFDIPIRYGNTELKVKFYGNKGEYYEEDKSFNIPNEFLKPGSLKYNASFAQDNNTKKKLGDAALSLGIFDWLTSTVNFSKVEASKDYSLVSRSSINLFNNSMLNMLATNNGIYEVGLKIPRSIFGSWDVIYTNYEKTTDASYKNNKSTLYFMNSITRPFDLPVSFSFYGSRNMTPSNNSNRINSNLIFNLGKLNFRFRHNLSFNENNYKINNVAQNLNSELSYYINKMPKFLNFLGRARLNASLNYIPEFKEILNYTFSIEQFLTRNSFLSFNYTHSTGSNQSFYALSLNINTSNFRSKSTTNYRDGSKASYSSDISGIIEYDSYSHKINLSNSLGSNNHTGRSAAVVRFFMDNNNNGKFDDNDNVIKEADFSLIKSFARKKNFGDYKIITNLQPGSKYTIKVNKESFPNPSVIPKFSELAFIADPYSYKMIDIPCHQGGIIEGYVERMIINKENNKPQEDLNNKDNLQKNIKSENIKYRGQGGLKVHIMSNDSVFSTTANAFSDGSYFFTGIPIGHYKIFIDKKQLEILDCYSVPEYINIEIKAVSGGDFIGDMNFNLIEKTKKATKLPSGITSNLNNEQNNEIANLLMNMPDIIDISYASAKTNEPVESSFGMLDTLALILNYNVSLSACIIDISNVYDKGDFQQRAGFIIGYLSSKGIDENRIKFQSQIKDKAKTQKFKDIKSNDKNLKITLVGSGN